MRRWHKKQCCEALKLQRETLAEAEQLTATGSRDDAAVLLEQCQQGAIELGTFIDETEGDGTRPVRLLEEYCETLYLLHERLVANDAFGAVTETAARDTENTAGMWRGLLDLLDRTGESIREDLPDRYEAVFLPYKVSMWDSLETIWRAAAADPACDAYVIPIPYFDKTPDGTLGEEHCDADRYSAEVKITRHEDFDLEAHHPEFIFFHNPYDQHNHTTSVHPLYYSKHLRACTERLVYVPYYATTGGMAESQALLTSYFYADDIVVQSEATIGLFDSQVPREKFLPLGSPKFDSIIEKCKNPPEPPEEWRDKLDGKRVYFFNTSIHGILNDTPAFLKKMAYVFDVFAGREDACLIWRPHPLLETTIDSLRPETRPVYDALKRRFLDEEIGILDETPQIEPTIALCDAYLGDGGTSVTALFGVVGKPMFLLNNRVHEAPGADDWRAGIFQALRADWNNRYCITMGNRLFEDREGDLHYHYLCDLPADFAGGGYYSRAIEDDDRILVFPANAQHILLIERGDLSARRIELKQEIDRDGAFSGFFNLPLTDDPELWWILPNRYPAMVRFDSRTEEVVYFRDEAFTDAFAVHVNDRLERIIAARWVHFDPDLSRSMTESVHIPGLRMRGIMLLCMDTTGTRLRAVDLMTGDTEERTIEANALYIGVIGDPTERGVLWFIPYEGTKLGRWDLKEDRWESVDVRIDGLVSLTRPQRKVCDNRYFSNAIFTKDKRMILAPNWGNRFVERDMTTGACREWTPPFPVTTDDRNAYWYNGSIGYFQRYLLNPVCEFFYAPEHITYRLDPDTGACEEVKITFDRDEIFAMAPGFHRDSQWMPYCCFEDIFNTLPDIAAGIVHGPAFDRQAQIEAYRAVNASPDGDCGAKVWEAVLARLRFSG
ncbi:MAG: hypothetical protein K6G16_10805 [Lachnospiraceae bacterium]|nr:hypothetical protein [Lachnospiraceae bacterium]